MASFADKLLLAAQEDDEEEQDLDYVPQEKEEKQFEKDLLQNMPEKQRKKLEKKHKNIEKRKKMVAKAWQLIQQDELQAREKSKQKFQAIQDYKTQPKDELQEISQQIAQKVIDDHSKTEIKKVRFAGKDFLVDDKGNIMNEEYKEDKKDENKEEKQNGANIDEFAQELQKIQSGFRYMNQLMEKIKTKTKTLSSLSKSKYDWKKYAKKEKIESQLEQNRKGGYLQKQNFIQETKFKQKEINIAQKNKLRSSGNR